MKNINQLQKTMKENDRGILKIHSKGTNLNINFAE